MRDDAVLRRALPLGRGLGRRRSETDGLGLPLSYTTNVITSYRRHVVPRCHKVSIIGIGLLWNHS